MTRYTKLADALRAEGLTVIETTGWRTRGSSVFSPRGSVNHHTAGSKYGNAPSLNVCINGRTGVPGPLCHVLLARDSTCYVIAAGRANHAGRGSYRGLSGNRSVFGLEVEHTGYAAGPKAEGLSPARRDAMVRVHVAFARLGGFDESMVCQHYEWAPTRKIDFVRALLDPDRFRASIGAAMGQPPGGDDLTPEQDKRLKRIEQALWEGVPSYGQGAILAVANQANYSLAGVGEDTIRDFIQGQDRAHSADVKRHVTAEHKITRNLTSGELDDLWTRIEALANEGGDGGPINVSDADAAKIASAVGAMLGDHPLAPTPPI